MLPIARREFLQVAVASGAAWAAGSVLAEPASAERMKLGLVTYNWGQNWDLPTLIANCAAARFEGAELRTTHKHGVELRLTPAERRQVREQFAASEVKFVGIGSACDYHSPDPAVLKKNIEETKAFIRLSADIGGSGVKVRPNGLPKDVPVEKTIEQIGLALREVARDAADFGQVIRVEVHGAGTSELPILSRIMEIAEHPAALVCWNCNSTDLSGEGLAHNFKLVAGRINTVHIHDLRSTAYPWADLFQLLHEAKFTGWTLLEDGAVPPDIVAAMKENRPIWEKLALK